MKHNFNETQKAELNLLVLDSVYNNTRFTTPIGTLVSIQGCLHDLEFNTLVKMYNALNNRYESLKKQSEIFEVDETLDKTASELDDLKLIMQYRLFKEEEHYNSLEKEKLAKELELLKESVKTPQDRIAELENKLKELE